MKAIITVGLGFGDEGKGASVDYLCRKHPNPLVVRYSGGCQASHRVVLPNGHSHKFSQFGAGTFARAPTYLDRAVIVDPLAMRNEWSALKKLVPWHHRVPRVHPQCLISTRLHKQANQRDTATLSHGTCGMGIGATRKYWLEHGQDAPVVDDLTKPWRLAEKIDLLAQRLGLRASPNTMAAELVSASSFCMYVLAELPHVGSSDTVIFEGAQGILLDEKWGHHPNTTWSDVTANNALDLCAAMDISDIEVLGICRSYMTRHGNGPLPTESDLGLTDPGNTEHEFQGKLRYGVLDLPLLIEAASHVGCKLDGLVVNHLDQFPGKAVVTTNRDANIWDTRARAARGNLEGEYVSEESLLTYLSHIAPVKITGHGETFEHRKEH